LSQPTFKLINGAKPFHKGGPLSPHQEGIDKKAVDAGHCAPFTDSDERYKRAMKLVDQFGIDIQMVSYDTIKSSIMTIDNATEDYKYIQGRKKYDGGLDDDRILNLYEDIGSSGLKRMPIVIKIDKDTLLKDIGFGRLKVIDIIDSEGGDTSGFNLLYIPNKTRDGKEISRKEMLKLANRLSARSNAKRDSDTTPQTAEEFASTLQSYAELVGWDYGNEDHVEKMKGYLFEESGIKPTQKRMLKKIIAIASGTRAVKEITRQETTKEIYEERFPNSVWDQDVNNGSNGLLHLEVASTSTSHSHTRFSPLTVNFAFGQSQVDFEVIAKTTGKETGPSVLKEIGEFKKLWRTYNMSWRHSRMKHPHVCRRIGVLKSRDLPEDKDRFWEWEQSTNQWIEV